MDGVAIVEPLEPLRVTGSSPRIRECDRDCIAVYLGYGEWILPEGYRVQPGPIERAIESSPGSKKFVLLPNFIEICFREEEQCWELPLEFCFDYARLSPDDRQFRVHRERQLPDHYHWMRVDGLKKGVDGKAHCNQGWHCQ